MSATRDSMNLMPSASSTSTSRRLLALLSLLQVRRDWPGGLLAERLRVSERTVRRDIDRLRELGYPVRAVKGPDGGYRLEAGSELPPLLFDDEQAVALAVALRTAVGTGAGIEEAAARALATVRQVLPTRLRRRVDALEFTAVKSTGIRAASQPTPTPCSRSAPPSDPGRNCGSTMRPRPGRRPPSRARRGGCNPTISWLAAATGISWGGTRSVRTGGSTAPTA
ncbi:hypothetical protein NWFMUON74_37360 [Nocardia wallacei]|uniref:HTH deoR-type domain-containing protein n=1 Tax=Nocardia wallacei TaxID=480035 RepID=A0A7G1KRW9_9NOCA|nr:hypothetical protein NWFMUON74_37360 [Nocardia wallacei]